MLLIVPRNSNKLFILPAVSFKLSSSVLINTSQIFSNNCSDSKQCYEHYSKYSTIDYSKYTLPHRLEYIMFTTSNTLCTYKGVHSLYA